MIFYNEEAFVEELVKRKGGKIVIYGAGCVGKMVVRRLERHGIKIYGFCVTKRPDIKNDNSYPTYNFDDVCDLEDVFFVVSVTGQHREEMTDNLIRKGITDYAVIGDKLIVTLDRIINRKLRLQTHITDHCNLKCRGCYHFSSLAKENFLSVEAYKKDIIRLSELFDGKMEEILLLGGEPLLHPSIEEFFHVTRDYFPYGHIKLLTNGLLLLNVSDSFFMSIKETDSELWVTKYPVSFDYDEAEKRAERLGVKVYYFNREPVRTLGHQPLDLSGKQDYKRNFYGCYRANQCIDLREGRLYPCIIPAEIKPFCDYFDIDIPVTESDSIDIYDVHDASDLLERLEKPTPFCRFCNRKNINKFGVHPWSVTRYSISEWTD